jgi:methyltransferase (TIGR00027 family)
MNQPLVSHVSDTARWVAVYRAWESSRPDALFRDPFAERLAGERGAAIARLMPRQARSGWPIIVRTKLIDDFVLSSLAEGCDCVINLAAGLDSRPYRMPLPPELPWFEVDFPAMVEEKQRLMADAQPVCRLARRGLDLLDPAARAVFFAELGDTAKRALVITEGLLVYMNENAVRTLALDLAVQPGIRWWTFDLASPNLLQLMQKTMGTQLVNAPMQFGPADGVAFFEALGWATQDVRSFVREAVRLHRLPWFLRPFSLFPEPDPRRLGNARWSAAIRLSNPANWRHAGHS